MQILRILEVVMVTSAFGNMFLIAMRQVISEMSRYAVERGFFFRLFQFILIYSIFLFAFLWFLFRLFVQFVFLYVFVSMCDCVWLCVYVFESVCVGARVYASVYVRARVCTLLQVIRHFPPCPFLLACPACVNIAAQVIALKNRCFRSLSIACL